MVFTIALKGYVFDLKHVWKEYSYLFNQPYFHIARDHSSDLFCERNKVRKRVKAFTRLLTTYLM